MDVKIIDTTLRDGEQRAGMVFDIEEKQRIATLLSFLEIDVIEAGVPAMGGIEKKSVERIVNLNLNSKISAWNRMSIEDIQHSIDCNVDIIHISVPASDIQIKLKLAKNRQWVISQMAKCIMFARDKGFQVNVGFEDASRADFDFLVTLGCIAVKEGVSMLRYSDTVGVLHLTKIRTEITILSQNLRIPIGIHAHNDFGMAVANSLAAAESGAVFVDCTIGGIGERAGNCNYLQFINALKDIYDYPLKYPLSYIEKIVREIEKVISIRPII